MGDVTPGAELKRHRRGAGLTLDQLADAVGVTQSAVTQWEAGRTVPRLSKALALDDALKADGAIIAAFGYARPVSQRDEVAELRALVADLGEQQAEMAARLAELGAEVALLRGRSRRAAAG